MAAGDLKQTLPLASVWQAHHTGLAVQHQLTLGKEGGEGGGGGGEGSKQVVNWLFCSWFIKACYQKK